MRYYFNIKDGKTMLDEEGWQIEQAQLFEPRFGGILTFAPNPAPRKPVPRG